MSNAIHSVPADDLTEAQLADVRGGVQQQHGTPNGQLSSLTLPDGTVLELIPLEPPPPPAPTLPSGFIQLPGHAIPNSELDEYLAYLNNQRRRQHG